MQAQFQERSAAYTVLVAKLHAVHSADQVVRNKEWEEARKVGGKIMLNLLAKRVAETKKNRQRNQSI